MSYQKSAGSRAGTLLRALQSSAQCHSHRLTLPALAKLQGKTRNNSWDTPRNVPGCGPSHLSQLFILFHNTRCF